MAMVVAVVLVCGVVLGGVTTSLLSEEPAVSPSATPSPAVSPSASHAAVEVPGEDIDRLPRYPGSVRTHHEVARDDLYRLTVTEYSAEAAIDAVRAFYQGVILEHRWERADISFDHGEWSYILVDGAAEALIEIEEFGGVVEIDLQMSEPVVMPRATGTPAPTPTPTQTPSPTPDEPDPTPAPTAAPIAPPPPPPGDDDDGDDDGGGDDSDDEGGSDDG